MNKDKRHIAFVTPSLVAGGAERIVSFLAQELDRTQYDVTLVVFGFEKDTAYSVDGINTIFFNKTRVLKGLYSFYKFLKSRQPDLVLSTIGHLNTLVAYTSIFFPKIKFVAREVNVLSVLSTFDEPKKFNPFKYLSKNRFYFFDAVVCQSNDMKTDIVAYFKVDSEKLHIINNPITSKVEIKTTSKSNDILRCITIARLSKEKGVERVLMALSKLKIPFHYTLIGDGDLKLSIYKLIDELGLKNVVTHIPFTKDVNSFLKSNDLYLQGSYVEGFPNALVESCVVGTPVVAFNALGGMSEIIIEEVNGYVAKNEAEFLNYVEMIHQNNPFNPEIVSDSVVSRYHKSIIVKQYETLFNQLINS